MSCIAHMWGCLSGTSSAKMPELMTSRCFMSWTEETNAFDDHGGFVLWAAIKLLSSSLWTPAGRYMINWWLFILIWIHSHSMTSSFQFLLLSVWRTIFKCAMWVRCLDLILAASLWTTECLRSGCTPMIAILNVAPTNWLHLDPLPLGWGGCVTMICWCEIEKEDHKKRTEVGSPEDYILRFMSERNK
jgi:hypothetical protein